MRTLSTILITNLIAFSGVFYGAACQAEVIEYDIEVVIFEDTSNRYINSEEWPKIDQTLQPESKTPGNTSSKKSKTTEDQNIDTTEHEINLLGNQVSALKASTRYNILVHKAWRQIGLDAESANDVYIDSAATDIKKKSGSNIKGTIKVVLGRYLHIYTDMIYNKPYLSAAMPTSDNGYIAPQRKYVIKSHRRMRSNELHYIDHPLVGMLVKAVPVEPLEVEEKEKVTDPSIDQKKSVTKAN